MDAYRILGKTVLKGEVNISGSKNASLPIIAATILVPGEFVIKNVPRLRDIYTMIELLNMLGAKTRWVDEALVINTHSVSSIEAPYSLVKKMRASFIIAGPLLARFKKARVALPGGCAIGTRPVDIHVKGFKALGCNVEISKGYMEADTDIIKGNKIFLDFPSVGATENIMLAACLGIGETVIENAAKEPEIIELANFLNKMGAIIKGMGTDVIFIKGVSQLYPTEFTVMPDRIETGTLISAVGVTGGSIVLKKAPVISSMKSIINKLEEAGIEIIEKEKGIIMAKSSKRLLPVNVKTLPYPGFPTDMQAQLMVLCTMAEGTSIITETIFENRFMHVPELIRMGANIKVEEHNAIVNGVDMLSGAEVMCSDLRAGAALVLAAMAADGESIVQRIYHIERGYESFEDKLNSLGANITRIKVPL